MPSDLADIAAIGSKAGKPPLIEYFAIEGLHGYRTVAFSSGHAATILIARNGSGKTTLLGAMDALLKRQFFRLRDLAFKRILCKFTAHEDTIVVTRENIDDLLVLPSDDEFIKLSRRMEIPESELFQFIISDWVLHKKELMSMAVAGDHRIFSAILRLFDYERSRVTETLDALYGRLLGRNTGMLAAVARLNEVLENVDVVYLPTYRRIELALRGDHDDVRRGRGRSRPRFQVAAGGLLTNDIQFGLSDISDRLAELNTTIVSSSSIGYRQLSANVINDMIDGRLDNESESSRQVPSEDDLRLFFSRLEAGGRYGPYFPVQTPDLKKISKAGQSGTSGRFLNYFLHQLGSVIDSTKDIERSVENFVEKCNKYLLSDEDTTQLQEGPTLATSKFLDGKKLQLNRRDLSVSVESVPDGRTIPLDALSSGEKQMISLFAKLYLYEKPKIVLVDEPELSLSIDWQRSILVDVLTAPLCRQVVAITHSPFVFDNELEPFARSLRLQTAAPEPQRQ